MSEEILTKTEAETIQANPSQDSNQPPSHAAASTVRTTVEKIETGKKPMIRQPAIKKAANKRTVVKTPKGNKKAASSKATGETVAAERDTLIEKESARLDKDRTGFDQRYSDLLPDHYYSFAKFAKNPDASEKQTEHFGGRLVALQGSGKVTVEITKANRTTELKTDVAVRSYRVRKITRETAFDISMSS